MSGITIHLVCKRPFHWISKKSRLMRAARGTSKFLNWSLLTYSCRRYITEILPIPRITLSNQTINVLTVDVFIQDLFWSCGQELNQHWASVEWYMTNKCISKVFIKISCRALSTGFTKHYLWNKTTDLLYLYNIIQLYVWMC